jgi:hypothetical protein
MFGDNENRSNKIRLWSPPKAIFYGPTQIQAAKKTEEIGAYQAPVKKIVKITTPSCILTTVHFEN